MALNTRLTVAAVAALSGVAIMPAFAQRPIIPDYALDAWFGENRRIMQPAFEWAKQQRMTCDGPYDQTFPCTVASRTESVHVFSPDPELSVVQIFYNPSTGNRGTFAVLLMGRKKSGDYRVMREIAKVPNAILATTYEGVRLVFEVEVMKSGDMSCCLSGRARYACDLRTGSMAYLWGDKPEP